MVSKTEWWKSLRAWFVGFGLTFSLPAYAGFSLGAGALYVPSGGETFSGDPAVAGTEIDAGTVVFVNGTYGFAGGWRLQAELLWYQSETEETRMNPLVGPVKGTLDLEGLGGYLNLLYDLGSLFGWERLGLEAGGGIGYASFKNTVTTSVAGFSDRASDRDDALAWQAILNLQYGITERFSLGGSVRYFGFGDLKWEDEGRTVEAENIHSFAFGAFASVDF